MNSESLRTVVGFLCVSSAASAQQFIEFQTTLPPASVPSTQLVNLTAFIPALGVLRSVEVTLSASVTGTLSFENTNPTATVAPNYSVGAWVAGSGPNGVLGSPPNPAFEYTPPTPPPLGAFDGTLDFAGTSAVSIPFQDATGTGAPSITYPILTDALLPAWIAPSSGPPVVTFSVSTTDLVGGSLPSGIQERHPTSATITLRVRYTYDTLPTRICRGGPNAGCPCGNNGLNDGGCRNSGGGLGGTAMYYGGVASLSNDTLSLQHQFASSGAPVLFFQGTTFSYAQTVFGDGLICVGGTITRLGVKMSSVGSFPGIAFYPQAGDPSVSTVGGIVAPGNRYYQVFYRDAAVYCTSATHNVSSGLAFTWQP